MPSACLPGRGSAGPCCRWEPQIGCTAQLPGKDALKMQLRSHISVEVVRNWVCSWIRAPKAGAPRNMSFSVTVPSVLPPPPTPALVFVKKKVLHDLYEVPTGNLCQRKELTPFPVSCFSYWAVFCASRHQNNPSSSKNILQCRVVTEAPRIMKYLRLTPKFNCSLLFPEWCQVLPKPLSFAAIPGWK